jgi:hypothetical protein
MLSLTQPSSIVRSRTIEAWKNLSILILDRFSDFAGAWSSLIDGLFRLPPAPFLSQRVPVAVRDELAQAVSRDNRPRTDFSGFKAALTDELIDFRPAEPDRVASFGYGEG